MLGQALHKQPVPCWSQPGALRAAQLVTGQFRCTFGRTPEGRAVCCRNAAVRFSLFPFSQRFPSFKGTQLRPHPRPFPSTNFKVSFTQCSWEEIMLDLQ